MQNLQKGAWPLKYASSCFAWYSANLMVIQALILHADTVDLLCHKNSISLESLERLQYTQRRIYTYIPDEVGSILPAGSIYVVKK